MGPRNRNLPVRPDTATIGPKCPYASWGRWKRQRWVRPRIVTHVQIHANPGFDAGCLKTNGKLLSKLIRAARDKAFFPPDGVHRVETSSPNATAGDAEVGEVSLGLPDGGR